MTALTTFFSSAAATTVTTANKLYTISGTPTTTTSSTAIQTGTGWGEIFSQGTAGSWAGAGSAPSPSGHGFLLDSTLLENQQFGTGNWSGTIVVKTSSVTVAPTVVFHLRAYKRSSGGIFTNIVDIAATATSLSNTNSTISFSATAGTATTFTTGDKLYIDIPGNITVAAGLSGNIILLNLSTDTSGLTGSTSAEMVSPGYTVATTAHSIICDGYGGVFS